MADALPSAIATEMARLENAHRYRVLSTPILVKHDEWSFRVAVGPSHEAVGSSEEDWFEFEILCSPIFPFSPAHARPVRPLLKWHPHQNGHWTAHCPHADIICPPAIHEVGTSATLAAYLDHYRRWVEDALCGKLTAPEQRYELPHVIATAKVQASLYVDGGKAALNFASSNEFGLATIRSLTLSHGEAEVLAIQFMFAGGKSDTDFTVSVNQSFVKDSVPTKWVPWAFIGNPVAEKPHRPHLSWRDFTPTQARRIEAAITRWISFGREDRLPVILFGYGVPRTWKGGELLGVHWEAVDLSSLPTNPPSQAGFRQKAPPGRSHLFAWLNRGVPTLERRTTRDISIEAMSTRTQTAANQNPQNGPAIIRNVAIIGVGALGGCIAKSLMHSINANVVLVDPEKLEPGNLLRHELPAFFLERHKAIAMRTFFDGLRAENKVEALTKDVIAQWNDALPTLREADLLLDFTGSRAVSDKIAVAPELAGVKMGWAYLKPGPEWGVLALRPVNTTARLQDAEDALKATATTDWEKLERVGLGAAGLTWPEPGCHHPTFIAPFHRVRMLADFMVGTIVGWLSTGATNSLATLYHQNETTSIVGIEAKIVAQSRF
jgi:hypothetical protein